MLYVLTAYLCVVFADNTYKDKLLCVLMIIYTSLYTFIRYSGYLTPQDLINLYTVVNILICFMLFELSKDTIAVKLYVTSLVLPQAYYLYILYKPYVLSPSIPFWFLTKADDIFLWGIVLLVHNQKIDWDINSMTTREYIVSVGVLASFLLS